MGFLDFLMVKTRKRISNILFISAVVLAVPPLPFEFFTDLFLNLPLATFISNNYGTKILTALILTYTLVPILLIYIGAIIRPTDTTRTFNGQFLKLKNFFIKYINLVKRNPIHLAWLLVGFFVLYRLLGFYQTQINIYIFS